MFKYIFLIFSLYSLCFASFEGVSFALESYIQSSYELSSAKDPVLLKSLKEEKDSSVKNLLASLKEPFSQKDVKNYLKKVKNSKARGLYLDFYDYLYSFHLYLNSHPKSSQASLKAKASLLNAKLKDFILSSQNESYKGFLLKTRALFLKDVLNRLQKDLTRSNAYYLNSINLQGLISWINSRLGLPYINIGKISICLLVIFLFYLVMKLLTRVSSLAVFKYLQYFKNTVNTQDKHFKEAFLHKLQKPVQSFIMLYSFGLCIAISYYPTSMDLAVFRLLNLGYIWVIAWFVLNVLNSYGLMLISKIAIKSGQKEIINLVIRILYSLICIIAFLISLQIFGFNISAIIASLGIGGLAVALASKDIISNFFASVMLLFDDSFEQGDWVKVGSIEGNVVETGLRKTSIRGFDNTLAFIPNSTMMSTNIINYSRRKLGRKVALSLGVTYESSPEQIKKLSADILKYLKTSPFVAQSEDKKARGGSLKYRQSLVNLDDLEGYSSTIFVGLASFGDFSINIDISFYTKSVDGSGHRKDKEQILLELMKLVAKNGLSMAFPTQSLYIEKLPSLQNSNKE